MYVCWDAVPFQVYTCLNPLHSRESILRRLSKNFKQNRDISPKIYDSSLYDKIKQHIVTFKKVLLSILGMITWKLKRLNFYKSTNCWKEKLLQFAYILWEICIPEMINMSTEYKQPFQILFSTKDAPPPIFMYQKQ